LGAIIKPVACLATTIAISTALLAQEPLPIKFHNGWQADVAPISPANVTFPHTSAAPIRWKNVPAQTIRQLAHIDEVEHTTSEVGANSVFDREIEPVAFKIQLDAPKNAPTNDVQPVAGTSKRIRPRTAAQQDSVLSSRRTAQRQGSVIKPQSPAGDVQPTEAPDLIPPASDKSNPLVEEDVGTETVQLDDTAAPPQPAADPDDAAPTPPASLQPRATPQPPAESPRLRDPALTEQPPVARPTKKKRCSNPNDRDCCADEDICVNRLARIQGDTLRGFSKDRLDITPRYSPNELPEERERNAERKAQQMTLAGRREWQDKSGRPLGAGKLVDLALGKAIIEADSGEQAELDLRSLSDDDLCFIAAWYNLPTECTLGNEAYNGRDFVASTMTWKASALCHKPLYFEDVQLERYGHTRGPFVQPFVSGAHFFANVALLPYKMGINPPHECQYTLGYIRPGSCAPWMHQPFPLSARGAATATGFYTGANFLIP
jgi:hypothetical protein